MAGIFTINETLNTLRAIFEKHKNERVCVLASICVGKTTLVEQLDDCNCVDMDDELWPNIPEEEKILLNELLQKPWTKELGDEVDRLTYKYLKVKLGSPLFTTVIVDCEVIVYIDISDDLLVKHCEKRGDNIVDAKNAKESIEGDWNNHKAKNDKTLYYITVTE